MQPPADSSAGGCVDPTEIPWCIMPAYAYASLNNEDDQFTNPRTQELVDAQAQISGYRSSTLKYIFYVGLNIVTVFAPFLLGRWYCEWKVFFKYVPSTLRSATLVLVKDEDDRFYTCKVEHEPVAFLPDEFCQDRADIEAKPTPKSPLFSPFNSKPIFRHFTFRYEKFFWDDRQRTFRKLDGLEGFTCAQIIDNFRGLSHSKRQQMKTIYGPNVIDVQVKSVWKLLIGEILNPFYVFQLFSVTLWSFDDYYYYASCVVIISCFSIGISLHETRQQLEMLRKMAQGDGDFLVTVKRCDGEEEEICSRDLVPGDVLLIPPEGFIMPCDAVVVHGTCIVNESMLTGESIPVRKSAMLPGPDMYDTETLKRHTVFAGTHVIQTRFYAGNKASCVVVRTGFNTLKGSLIRSIMFPKEVGLTFYRDAMKFVLILFVVAFFGMGYAIHLYVKRGASWHTVLVRVLDIVTIVVPPALPAAMTVGTVYAQNRLKKLMIFCISPQKINFCGKLKLICFDKTGTLTEDGLDLWCVLPCQQEPDGSLQFQEPVTDPGMLPTSSPLLRGMATCHSLTFINGNLVGDPLDLKMFAGTEWELEEPLNCQEGDTRRFDLLTPTVVKKGDVEIGIIREFEFTPQLQRMCVVVKPLDSRNMMLFCKGAPEKVSPLCKNIPEDYDLMLDSFTVKGYRVLTLAYKEIEGIPWHQIQRVSREEIEKDMIFAGFLVMQNSLKPATIPVIAELRKGDIRSVMVTGDNMLTALSVARECGMIPACDKVVIVSADEDGRLEFTLAAHHYERETVGKTEESPIKSIGDNRVTSSMETEELSEVSPLKEPVFYNDMKTRRRSSVVSEEEVRIDMERLVEIAPDTLAETIVTLGLNYHFVLTGRTWNLLLQHVPTDILNKILAKGTVYARMSPEYKRQLVEYLQGIGYVVGMCGDGANDCAALKMAHVGISLSEAEASVAAPFTSKIPDISCVPHVIREGRCALVTSFGMFKYMALYSMVQFTTVLLLYTHQNNLSDKHFLYIDLGITTTIALVMGRTEPYHKIVPKRPMGSLISFQNLVSILSQILLASIIQISTIFYLRSQTWYTPVTLKSGDDLITICWETTTLFSVSAFQYLILGLVFSKGPPYRKRFYTNGFMMASYVVLTLLTIFVTVSPLDFLWKFLDLMPVSEETNDFRLHLLIFPVLNALLALGFETIISSTAIFHKILKSLGYKLKAKYRYQEILNELEAEPSWPRVKASA